METLICSVARWIVCLSSGAGVTSLVVTPNHPDRDALRKALAQNSKLVEKLQKTSSDIDQLLARRKEVLRGSFKRDEHGSGLQAAAPAASHAVHSSVAHPPVLIVVEDCPNDFLLLKRALWKAGATARVWWAHDIDEALSTLETVESSSAMVGIVSDVRMTGGDGWALLERVKARKSACVIKFAMLTGMADRRTAKKARDLGVDAFFTKPSQPAGLLEIARALQALVSSQAA